MNQVLNEDDGYNRFTWNVNVLRHVDEDNDKKLNLQEYTNDFNRVDEGEDHRGPLTPDNKLRCPACTNFFRRGRCRTRARHRC